MREQANIVNKFKINYIFSILFRVRRTAFITFFHTGTGVSMYFAKSEPSSAGANALHITGIIGMRN